MKILRWMSGPAVLLLTAFALGDTPAPATQRVRVDLPYKPLAVSPSATQPTAAAAAPVSDYERERCRLDLYLPTASAGPFPTVVWFHGGGLEGGDKQSRGTAALARAFAERGIACVVPNYRLSPKATYPAYLDDAAASVAWTLANISQHGGDAQRVFVGGHSAGGYLAAAIGYDRTYLARYGIDTGALAGLVPMSPQVFTHYTIRKEQGVADAENKPVIDAAAPAHHVRPDAPRTLVLVADGDLPARLEECQYFLAMLRRVKHPDASLQVIAGRNHSTILTFGNRPNDPAMAAMIDFMTADPTTRPTTGPATQP